MAIGSPCAVVQVLADWELNAIRMLNKKFAALQRLAQLIEQFGDINTWLPNLGRLVESMVPVDSLDINAYTNLQVYCPFLNLPPYSNEDLAELKSKVQTAYGQLLGQIAKHPYMRMDKLQGMLNDWQNKINYPYGEDYLRCMNAVCGAVQAAGTTLSGLANTNIGRELELFGQNFVENAGEILTEAQQIKRNEALGIYNQIADLRSEIVQDYQTLTVTGEVVPSEPPLRLGTPTGSRYTFEQSRLQEAGFPPSWPTSEAEPPSGVGSVIP